MKIWWDHYDVIMIILSCEQLLMAIPFKVLASTKIKLTYPHPSGRLVNLMWKSMEVGQTKVEEKCISFHIDVCGTSSINSDQMSNTTKNISMSQNRSGGKCISDHITVCGTLFILEIQIKCQIHQQISALVRPPTPLAMAIFWNEEFKWIKTDCATSRMAENWDDHADMMMIWWWYYDDMMIMIMVAFWNEKWIKTSCATSRTAENWETSCSLKSISQDWPPHHLQMWWWYHQIIWWQ